MTSFETAEMNPSDSVFPVFSTLNVLENPKAPLIRLGLSVVMDTEPNAIVDFSDVTTTRQMIPNKPIIKILEKMNLSLRLSLSTRK